MAARQIVWKAAPRLKGEDISDAILRLVEIEAGTKR
jgi:hypothetical protein